MILAVCLNPAVDVTYAVPALRPGTSHPVGVRRRAGGKGVNVARVLAQLGEPVTLAGFAGGPTGEWLRSELAGSEVVDRLTAVDGETRQTVAVVDSSDATLFNEPGPVVSAAEWKRLASDFAELVAGCSAVAMSGSVPPGAPADAYEQLASLARRAGVHSVVDSSKFTAADVFAPNRVEIGLPTGDFPQLLGAAKELGRRSGGAVVVSAGRDGLVAAVGEHGWTVRPPRQVDGNPTGAGDALTAGLARGIAYGKPWPLILDDAVALAAAAVAVPVAGQIDLDLYRALAGLADVQEVAPCP